MPEILQVLPSMASGGAEKVASNLAGDWARNGFTTSFALMNCSGEYLDSIKTTSFVYDLKSTRIRSVPYSLKRLLCRLKPDITLVHSWPLTSAAVLAWYLSGSPGKLFLCEHVCLSCHVNSDLAIPLFAVKTILRVTHPYVSGIIAVSNGAAKDLGFLSGLSPDSINVIYNPVVESPRKHIRVSSLAADCNLWFSRFTRSVISIGTLKPQKNHALLLDAFALVANELDLGLVILGEGRERIPLQRKVFDLGLANRVLMPGYVTTPDIWLNSADLFVLSSTFEGFANVVAEALACGTPVVSTDCPYGPSEILDNGRYGILVPVNDHLALADGIRQAFNRTWDREALRGRAMEFSIPKRSNEYLRLFGFT